MILHSVRETKGWMIMDYNSTWGYGYEFMLDAVQGIIDTDFRDQTKKLSTAGAGGADEKNHIAEVREADMRLLKVPALKEECSSLVVAGISSIMELPLQIAFFNETNIVRLYCPSKAFVEEHGEHVFDNYMNSIEINGYCTGAKRTAVETYRKENNLN